MSLDQQRARAERFRSWYETDGLKDRFDELKHAYAERVTQLDPTSPGFAKQAEMLTLARKAVDEVEGFVKAVMNDGAVAARKAEHIQRIEKMNPHKRRFLRFAPGF